MIIKQKLIFIILLLVSTTFIFSQQSKKELIPNEIILLENQLKINPQNTELLMKIGIAYHELAKLGNKNAVKKSAIYFKKLLQIKPENSEALTWYGSILTMKGRDAIFPLLKLKYVNDGLTQMDKAIKLDSTNITIRMIRGNTCLALPENIFHRIKTSIEDFEYLLLLNEKKSFDKNLLATIYLGLGNAYKKNGDILKARENWQKVINTSLNSKETNEAKKLLKETTD
ncbi:MAG: hypothetical protein ABIB46_05625 [bacterium]